MLRRPLVAVAAACVVAVVGVSPAASGAGVVTAIENGDTETSGSGGPSTPEVDASNEGGSVAVRIEVAGSTTGGRSFSSSSVRRVAPQCWYGRGMTGYEYYEYWKVGGPAREADTLDDYAAQGLLHQGYEEHATDTEGRWWEATCAFDTPGDVAMEYYRTHPGVYVVPGDPPPPVEVQVPPEVLAQVAFEAMELPAGTVRWNPRLPGSGATIINTDTWVWVEDAPVTASVTARVDGGQWARVDAELADLTVSAPGADTVSCPDAGTPWSEGAGGTSCALTFFRSSANQPVKSGLTVPTSTMTVTARWTASWVSSAGGAPTRLPDQDLVTTAEVPVAEVQAIVTRG